MIVMLGEFAFLNSSPARDQYLDGFNGGAAFCSFGGFQPGVIGSLARSIWRPANRLVRELDYGAVG